ncbi:hypothetical protein GCM10022221_13550 [Actinocorallia aurea]
MGPFELELSSPFFSGGGVFHGGPHEGGHQPPNWFVEFGMDLGAPGGTEVRAAFDGKITKVDLSTIDSTTPPFFGAQVFVRAATDELDPDAPGGVGAFYTHFKDLTEHVVPGGMISRGELMGVVVAAQPPHLHLALAERRNGDNFGVDLYEFFRTNINVAEPTSVKFFQDGSPPQA